jgi:hypothetical protein
MKNYSNPLFLSLLSIAIVLIVACVKPKWFAKKSANIILKKQSVKHYFILPKLLLNKWVISAICICTLAGIGYKVRAQFIVSDPVLATSAFEGLLNDAQGLIEAAEHTTQLVKSVKILGQTRDVFEKISSTVKEAKSIKNLLNKQVRMLLNSDDAMHALDSYRSLGFGGTVTNYQRSVNELITKNEQYIEQLQSVVSEGEQKMTDGERVQIINKITEITDEGNANVILLKSKYGKAMALSAFYKELAKTR